MLLAGDEKAQIASARPIQSGGLALLSQKCWLQMK